MPEAAVDEYRFAEPRQNEVGRARQHAVLHAKAIAETVDQPPYDQLRRRVAALHRPHDAAAFSG